MKASQEGIARGFSVIVTKTTMVSESQQAHSLLYNSDVIKYIQNFTKFDSLKAIFLFCFSFCLLCIPRMRDSRRCLGRLLLVRDQLVLKQKQLGQNSL